MSKNKLPPAWENKIWDNFCVYKCRIKEKCKLEFYGDSDNLPASECPITTQIVELDYVKK